MWKPHSNVELTRQVEKIALQCLRALSFSDVPLTLDELVEKLQEKKASFKDREILRAKASEAMRFNHKYGNVSSISKVNRITLALNWPRFTITETGRLVLQQNSRGPRRRR